MKVTNKLYGAILGDLCGQPYEFPVMKGPYTNVDIHNPVSHITDDTIMTLATAYAIMNKVSFEYAYKYFGKMYNTDGVNGVGYGSAFAEWIYSDFGKLNNSFGNGCLMRMSPIMYAAESERETDFLIAASCHNSHSHITSYDSCLELRDMYTNRNQFVSADDYNITPFKSFQVKAEPTVKFIKKLFVGMVLTNQSTTQECIIKAVECGGDTDTNASIIGELSNFHMNDITKEDVDYVESKLDPFLLSVLHGFNELYRGE